MTIAKSPATAKNNPAVTMYMIPMSLWSVVVSHRTQPGGRAACPVFGSVMFRQPALAGSDIDCLDREVHAVVQQTAELGAPARVRALFFDDHLESVRPARDHISFDEELGHVEGMDD